MFRNRGGQTPIIPLVKKHPATEKVSQLPLIFWVIDKLMVTAKAARKANDPFGVHGSQSCTALPCLDRRLRRGNKFLPLRPTLRNVDGFNEF
jgi:hypothetical protein